MSSNDQTVIGELIFLGLFAEPFFHSGTDFLMHKEYGKAAIAYAAGLALAATGLDILGVIQLGSTSESTKEWIRPIVSDPRWWMVLLFFVFWWLAGPRFLERLRMALTAPLPAGPRWRSAPWIVAPSIIIIASVAFAYFIYRLSTGTNPPKGKSESASAQSTQPAPLMLSPELDRLRAENGNLSTRVQELASQLTSDEEKLKNWRAATAAGGAAPLSAASPVALPPCPDTGADNKHGPIGSLYVLGLHDAFMGLPSCTIRVTAGQDRENLRTTLEKIAMHARCSLYPAEGKPLSVPIIDQPTPGPAPSGLIIRYDAKFMAADQVAEYLYESDLNASISHKGLPKDAPPNLIWIDIGPGCPWKR